MSKHNEKRKASFKNKSNGELNAIAKSGSLASACAIYHLQKQGLVPPPYDATAILAAKKVA